jgi:glycosyltransferase involved in cell wall biosynthesis
MGDGHPSVSIGLPVYNGEAYLRGALDSLLGQTFTDLELIISDNASTDRTTEICRAYAAEDPRVRYVRHQVNRGVAWNHNFALGQATGKYFRWASHDDLCAPDFLARCVKELDADPGLVLCHTRTVVLDGEGNIISHNGGSPWIGSPRTHERFRDLVGLGHRHWQPLLSFGVMRREAAVAAGGLGPHIGGDRTFLVRLALQGRLLEVDEELFFYREHAGQASSPSRGRAARNAWWDPSKTGRIMLPYFRLGYEYACAVHEAPISGPERRRCYTVLLRWPIHYWKHLAVDVKHAGEDVAARVGTVLGRRGPRPA